MNEALDILFFRTWWQYNLDRSLTFSSPYHWFNLAEGTAWLLFATLVLRRFLRHRKSRMELAYCLAFVTFAASDFREAWMQTSWLIWLKILNLVALLYLRRAVMSQHYPTARVF